jgi:hypothetical protein
LDDPVERKRRMTELRERLKAPEVKDIRFLPGEHDAGPAGIRM